jgi:PAS domain S-box-containing protein
MKETMKNYSDSKPVKILAVSEDNLISLRELITELIPDVVLLTASGGEKGIHIAAAEDPDVILLESVMPAIDGFEVCKKLKSDSRLSVIPVLLIMPLSSDRQNRIMSFDCGAEAFFSQPIDKIEFKAQINALVRIKSANIKKRTENERLSRLVEDRTRELNIAHSVTLKLLEGIRKEIACREKYEEDINENSQLLDYHLNNSPFAIIEWNSGFTITRWTGEAEKIFGFTEAEAIGKLITELNIIYEKDNQDSANVFQQFSDEPEKHGISATRNRTREGRPIYCEWYNSVMFNNEGKMISVLSHVIDITSRKKAEDEARRLNHMLEEKVVDTAARMEATNKELEAFSYSISHDLRAPLRHINGFANILGTEFSDQVPEEARLYLERITTSAKKLETLIDDLLSFSKSSCIKFEKSSLQMSAVVEEALENITPMTADRII